MQKLHSSQREAALGRRNDLSGPAFQQDASNLAIWICGNLARNDGFSFFLNEILPFNCAQMVFAKTPSKLSREGCSLFTCVFNVWFQTKRRTQVNINGGLVFKKCANKKSS